MDLDNGNAPEGYRKMYDRTIVDYYLKMDMNSDCIISKNEFIITGVKLLAENIDSLEKKGPNVIMDYINEFSNEFDKYDENGNGYITFDTFKKHVSDKIYVSED